jgi:nucleotide-binding universal stress UspA family protein
MKVLIGIDGSEHSLDAAALVGRLLAAGRDQLALYHSCDSVSFAEQVDETLQQRACQAVADVVFGEAKARLPAGLQAKVETIVGVDQAAPALIETAENWQAGLIVVGARGLGPIEGLLLGSVSSNVVRASRVPVLVVRNVRKQDTGVRVLVAYDRLSAGQHAAFLNQLSWPQGTTCKIAVVMESMQPGRLPDWIKERARDADTEAMSQVWVREHQQERSEKERELATFAQQLPEALRSGGTIVLEGNPAERLIDLVDREKPDIIVVGKAMKNFFDRLFLGSVSEKILSHASCSVLVIPAAG